MKKTVIYLLVLISLFSCNDKTSESKISKELIDLACEENLKQKKLFDSKSRIKIYKKYHSVYVFAKLDNNKFVETDFYELLKIYEKEFTSKFDSYNEFMYEVINEDFVLNENDFEEKSFNLDKDLNKEFESLPFYTFLKKYSIKKTGDKQLYLDKYVSSGNKLLTVSYLLYTKGYYVDSGCFNGWSGLHKFEKLIK